MMAYDGVQWFSTREVAEQLSLTQQHVRLLCKMGRIIGAKRVEMVRGYVWLIPLDFREQAAAQVTQNWAPTKPV